MSDCLLSSYDFELPETQIAQSPPVVRGQSRLLVVRKNALPGQGLPVLHEGMFADILAHLPPRCLLVVNNSRVIPARLFGNRASGGRVEFLLLTPPPLLEPVSCPPEAQPETGQTAGWHQAEAEGLLRSSKKVRENERIHISPELCLELLERGEYGRCRVRLFWQCDLQAILERLGSLPLPPYIHRATPVHATEQTPPEQPCPPDSGRQLTGTGAWGSDRDRYQTTYAREDKAGSVAAPTAGLHFTPELLTALRESGREIAEVTLYVGYGTFSPVRADDIREHAMHAEYVELSAEAAQAVNWARQEGRAIVAVGTTATRVLEGVYLAQHNGVDGPLGTTPQKTTKAEVSYQQGATGSEVVHQEGTGSGVPLLQPYAGWINIFLYPGKKFHVIDGLITNFHLPRSSLLMLVSALAGRQQILAAYDHAVQAGFRFFSYGDAMLIVDEGATAEG